MKFIETVFLREQRMSMGVEQESGRAYLAFPVSNTFVDYEEFYLLTDEQYAHFIVDAESAGKFADECRHREWDDLLFMKPGWGGGSRCDKDGVALNVVWPYCFRHMRRGGALGDSEGSGGGICGGLR